MLNSNINLSSKTVLVTGAAGFIVDGLRAFAQWYAKYYGTTV